MALTICLLRLWELPWSSYGQIFPNHFESLNRLVSLYAYHREQIRLRQKIVTIVSKTLLLKLSLLQAPESSKLTRMPKQGKRVDKFIEHTIFHRCLRWFHSLSCFAVTSCSMSANSWSIRMFVLTIRIRRQDTLEIMCLLNSKKFLSQNVYGNVNNLCTFKLYCLPT